MEPTVSPSTMMAKTVAPSSVTRSHSARRHQAATPGSTSMASSAAASSSVSRAQHDVVAVQDGDGGVAHPRFWSSLPARHMRKAWTNGSSSPSSTDCVLPVSWSVRRSLTIW